MARLLVSATSSAPPAARFCNGLHVVKPNGRSLDPEVAAQFHCLPTTGELCQAP
jgi:hypothetical protein